MASLGCHHCVPASADSTQSHPTPIELPGLAANAADPIVLRISFAQVMGGWLVEPTPPPTPRPPTPDPHPLIQDIAGVYVELTSFAMFLRGIHDLY